MICKDLPAQTHGVTVMLIEESCLNCFKKSCVHINGLYDLRTDK